MQKKITQFKVTIDEVESVFYFESTCPVATAKIALFECIKWMGQIEDAQKAAMAESDAKSKEENSNPDIKPEGE